MQEQLKPFKTVEQIAKKHRLDVSFIEKQIKIGEPIEHEHTKNHELAREIALQHLDEIPDYYTRLKKMEADAKKHHKKFKDVKEETKSGDEGLHDWFGKSKSSDGKRGWVQLGGKYAGKPCARQPGQTSTPKCGSSKMAANLSPEEEERARRRKNRLDPNQPQKSGGAKPTNVRTEEWSDKYKRSIDCNNPKGFSQRAHCQGRKKKMNEQSFQIDTAAHKSAQKQQKIRNLATGTSNPNEKSAALRKLSGPSLPLADEYINEVKDKPSKGSGTKDACYHKVKSRYDVWPSAYASGALVKCRKVGAANWGTKSEETVVDEAQKCWPGYKKKGTKKMFGKTYNNCVKESEEMRYCPLCKKSESKTECSFGPALWEKYSIARVHPANEEKDYEFQMARNQLQTAKRSIDKLMKKLKGEGNMEAWVQSKITKASDYLDSVSDYMEGDRDEIEESNLMKYNEYGQTYIIRFSWRGLMYKVQIFIPSLKKPSAQEIKTQLNKIYPGAMLLQFEPRENDPVDPTIVFAKEDREYRRMLAKERQAEKEKESKRGGQRSHTPGKKAASAGRDYASYQERSISAHDKATKGKHTIGNPFAEELVNEVAAWQRKEGKNPTGGLNRKGIESYRRENPGSKLSMAVTTPPSKLDPDSKAAKRRKSFCARMGGMRGPMKDEKGRPTRKALSLRKWNC